MTRNAFIKKLSDILSPSVSLSCLYNEDLNFLCLSEQSEAESQNSTNDAFSKKWNDFSTYEDYEDKATYYNMQKRWYLDLFGFPSEDDLVSFLRDLDYIYDAGCGLGFKAAWLAQLAPHAVVVGVDFSQAAQLAAEQYADLPNLFFIQADIAQPTFKENSIDYVYCDQVIMHTEDPKATFAELAKITKNGGDFSCYFYAKKALPRELLDDYFRSHCTNMTHEELLEMSDQLVELGKALTDLNVTFNAPAIPALGIKGGKTDLQRFIYWNFIKCFWNLEMGKKTSAMVNYDWYSPTNAQRFSKEEVQTLVNAHNLHIKHFHEEEACISGRFTKTE